MDAKQSSPMRAGRCLIIAEAGVNHNGDMQLALRLVDAAVNAGADMVKFQTFRADQLVSVHAPKADYQKATTDAAEPQREMLRRLELPPAAYAEIAAYCRQQGIGFLSTPFDHASIALLAEMDLTCWKIPSGEITNLPYLRCVGSIAQHILLSTGMSTLEEVGAALDILTSAGALEQNITLLHCTTEYPAPFAEVNLRAMANMRAAFPRCAGVGYSDHSKGIEVSIAAAALGACVIEKHFTLSRGMVGPDHKASLEPHELESLVAAVRHVESALGDGEKHPTQSELPNRALVRKSIVAACPIRVGEVLTSQNLTVKRPGTGISPMLWDSIIGTVAQQNYAQDELL